MLEAINFHLLELSFEEVIQRLITESICIEYFPFNLGLYMPNSPVKLVTFGLNLDFCEELEEDALSLLFYRILHHLN